MINRKAHIFIDEFATPSLDVNKSGVRQYFVYAAVIIADENLELARCVHQDIVDSLYQHQFIKSSKISNDKYGYQKRIKTFEKLRALDYFVQAIVVDKKRISHEGPLAYKKVFEKYFQRLLLEPLRERFSEIHIVMDGTGWPQFRQELVSYMQNKVGLQPDLFRNNSYSLKEDRTEEPLIQLADFYAGCIGKYFCGDFLPDERPILSEIQSRLYIQWFPKEYTSIYAIVDEKGEFCLDLLQYAQQSVLEYIENAKEQEGKSIAELLLQESRVAPLRYVSSPEIKSRLLRQGIVVGDPITEIAKLREKGVLIVSPKGKRGYKLPTNMEQVIDFFNRMSNNVIPQLQRGFIFAKSLSERSVGKYNVWDTDGLEKLHELISNVNNQSKK